MDSTYLKQVEGGSTVKQGDTSSLFTFQLLNDKKQSIKELEDSLATITLSQKGQVYYEAVSTVNDGRIVFGLDKKLNAGYCEAVKEICSFWGVPVLDMKDYTKVPMWYSNPTVDKGTTVAKARGPRAAAFMDNTEHPNAAGHEFMSTIVENFLFSL